MKNIAIHYSGGIDSTYLVYKINEQYDNIHLVTFLVPFDLLHHQTLKPLSELKKICRNKNILHQFININKNILHVRGGIIKCEQDNKKHQFAYSWCLGCKLVMHASMIIYCRKHGISEVADGSQANDLHATEQHPGTLKLISQLYSEFEIAYSNPIYNDYDQVKAPIFLRRIEFVDDSKKGREVLRQQGFKLPIRFIGQHRTNQPFCAMALLLNILRLFRPEKKQSITSYFNDKKTGLISLIERGVLE